jgi:hypothetical protein
MDKLSPGGRRALRQALLYGYLVEREGRFYNPGSTNIVCSRTVLAPLLHPGLIEIRGDGTKSRQKADELLRKSNIKAFGKCPLIKV